MTLPTTLDIHYPIFIVFHSLPTYFTNLLFVLYKRHSFRICQPLFGGLEHIFFCLREHDQYHFYTALDKREIFFGMRECQRRNERKTTQEDDGLVGKAKEMLPEPPHVLDTILFYFMM